jgi:hypothetical protein
LTVLFLHPAEETRDTAANRTSRIVNKRRMGETSLSGLMFAIKCIHSIRIRQPGNRAKVNHSLQIEARYLQAAQNGYGASNPTG